METWERLIREPAEYPGRFSDDAYSQINATLSVRGLFEVNVLGESDNQRPYAH